MRYLIAVLAGFLLFFTGFAQENAPRVVYGVISPGDVNDIPSADRLFERMAEEFPEVVFERVAYDVDLISDAPPDVVAVVGVTVNEDLYFYPTQHPMQDVSDLLLDVRFPERRIGTVFAHEVVTAGTLYALGRCDEIEEVLLYPTEFNVMRATLRGNCAILDENYEGAIDAFVPVVDSFRYEQDIDPNKVPAVVNLAWVWLQQGNAEAAIDVMDRLVARYAEAGELYPYTAVLAYRSRVHALAFNFDAAIADITTAIELETQDARRARYFKLRGDHIFLIYEWDRVLEDYNRAVALAPDYADAYFARGVLFYTQGPRPSALEDFRQFVELAPDDPRVPQAEAYIESIEAELAALGGDDTGAFGPSD